MTKLQRLGNSAECCILRDVTGANRVAGRGDETTRHVGGGAQDGRDTAGCAARYEFDIAILIAISSDGRLDRLVRFTGHADRPHVAGRMGAHVTYRVQHLAAENGRRQPCVEGRGLAVLPDHQGRDLCTKLVLQKLHGLDIIHAPHFPRRRGGRRTDGGSRRHPVVFVQFVDGDEFRRTGVHCGIAQHPSMVDPAATAGRIDRASPHRGFHILLRQNSGHFQPSLFLSNSIIVFARTSAAKARSAASAHSSGQWERPSRQGTKSIAEGHSRAMNAASWPAPDTIFR